MFSVINPPPPSAAQPQDAMSCSQTPAAAPLKPQFYTQKETTEFLIQTTDGPRKITGRRAYVPALPGLSFFYHVNGGEAKLTEARTGLAFATEQFYGRRHLHHQVDFILKRRSAETIKQRIDACTPKAPLNR